MFLYRWRDYIKIVDYVIFIWCRVLVDVEEVFLLKILFKRVNKIRIIKYRIYKIFDMFC